MKMIPDPWEIKEVGFYLVFISFSQNYQKKLIFFGTGPSVMAMYISCGAVTSVYGYDGFRFL